MKICINCKKEKELTEFAKRKARNNNPIARCRDCSNIQNKEYRRRKTGVVSSIFKGQRSSSRTRGHRMPEYTQQELQEWLFSQTLFHELYDEWVQSGYLRRLKPSIDRKHDDIHYCMSNIQLMTWGENDDKGKQDHKSGKLKYDQKPIFQYSKEGILISGYLSIAQARRQTGVSSKEISLVCRGQRKTAGGFIWNFQASVKG